MESAAVPVSAAPLKGINLGLTPNKHLHTAERPVLALPASASG
jgi:hypothetical protein